MEEIRMRMLNRVNAGGNESGSDDYFTDGYCSTCQIYLWTQEEYNEHEKLGHRVAMNSTVTIPVFPIHTS